MSLRHVEVTRVVEAYLHYVPPSAADDAPRLSDLSMTIDDPTDHFLLAHFSKLSTDQRATVAVESEITTVTPVALAESFSGRLGNGSRRLAEHLHRSMTHHSTPAGYLAVALMNAVDVTGDPVRVVGLAKIDADEVATRPSEEGEEQAGTLRIDIAEEDEVFPQPGRALQKAALVRSGPSRHEMLIVDAQKGGTAVARYWFETFLQAEARMDRATRTEEFKGLLVGVQNSVRGRVSDDDLHRLQLTTVGLLAGDRVDLNAVAQDLPTPEAREAFAAAVADSRLDLTAFELDPETQKRVLRTSEWSGDASLTVRIDSEYADHVYDLGRNEPLPPDAPATHRRIVAFTDNVTQKR